MPLVTEARNTPCFILASYLTGTFLCCIYGTIIVELATGNHSNDT